MMEDFFGAHEILERVWLKIKNKQKDRSELIKGFINGASTFVLYKRGKDSYPKTWKSFQKYLYLLKEEEDISLRNTLSIAEKVLTRKFKKYNLTLF